MPKAQYNRVMPLQNHTMCGATTPKIGYIPEVVLRPVSLDSGVPVTACSNCGHEEEYPTQPIYSYDDTQATHSCYNRHPMCISEVIPAPTPYYPPPGLHEYYQKYVDAEEFPPHHLNSQCYMGECSEDCISSQRNVHQSSLTNSESTPLHMRQMPIPNQANEHPYASRFNSFKPRTSTRDKHFAQNTKLKVPKLSPEAARALVSNSTRILNAPYSQNVPQRISDIQELFMKNEFISDEIINASESSTQCSSSSETDDSESDSGSESESECMTDEEFELRKAKLDKHIEKLQSDCATWKKIVDALKRVKLNEGIDLEAETKKYFDYYFTHKTGVAS